MKSVGVKLRRDVTLFFLSQVRILDHPRQSPDCKNNCEGKMCGSKEKRKMVQHKWEQNRGHAILKTLTGLGEQIS